MKITNLLLIAFVIAAASQASAALKCQSQEKLQAGESAYEMTFIFPSTVYVYPQMTLTDNKTGNASGDFVCSDVAYTGDYLPDGQYICTSIAGTSVTVAFWKKEIIAGNEVIGEKTVVDLSSSALNLNVKEMACD